MEAEAKGGQQSPLEGPAVEAFERMLAGLARGSTEHYAKLSPAGRALFLQLAEPILLGAGESSALEALYAIDYERIPPTPADFLDSSDYAYESARDLFPAWRPIILRACDPANAIYEVNITGASAIGKTTAAMFIFAYKLTRLFCLRDPAAFYGLSSRSKIYCGLYAITKKLIKQVGFHDLRDKIIDQMPFFRDLYPRVPHGSEYIRWPRKNIEVITGSSELHAIGRSLFMVAADELNYYAQGEKTSDRAHELVAEVSRRLEGRFVQTGGDIPGVAIYLSQTRTTSDYLERRFREKKGVKGVLCVRGPRWGFNPLGYSNDRNRGFRPDLGDPAFRVFTGSDVSDPRILDRVASRDDGSVHVEPIDPDEKEPEGNVIQVPVVHYRAFLDDLHGALRNIADVPSGAFTPFFPRREIIEVMFDESLPQPFMRQDIPCFEGDEKRLQDFFDHRLVTQTHMGRLQAIRHPEAPRFIHLDLSQSGDRTGFVMVHASSHHYDHVEPGPDDPQIMTGEVIKNVEVDFHVALTAGPFGQPIDFRKVRVFIAWLRDIGFHIRLVTCDQYQCLAKGTRVATDRGLIPIEEIEVGDLVQTREGLAPVRQRFAFGRRATKVLRTRHGDVLECAPQHRIEVLGGWQRLASGDLVPRWEWRALQDCAVGDVVRLWDRESDFAAFAAPLVCPGDLRELGKGYNNIRSAIDSWEPPREMTPELAEWLGLVWGDGDITEDGVRLTIGGWDEVDDACNAFAQVFGVPFEPGSPRGEVGTTTVRVSARWLVRWMELNGMRKPTVPECVMRSGRFIQAAFLRGLFAADGSVAKTDGQVCFVTQNIELAQQVRMMLRVGWGFETCLTAGTRKPGQSYATAHPAIWRVTVRGSRAKFYEAINFTYARKRAELRRHKDVGGRRIFTRIVAIEDSAADLYELEVHGDPSYVAGSGFVNHNSADMLQRLRENGFLAEIQSVDRTSVPYRDVRSALNEGRVAAPWPRGFLPRNLPEEEHARRAVMEEALKRVILYQELAGLEHDVQRDKVDHRETNPDGSRGSKDVADGLAGSVYRCLTDNKAAPGQKPGTKLVHPRKSIATDINRYLPKIG